MPNQIQNSHFSFADSGLDMNRSRFNRPSDLKTSFNVGDIIPVYLDEILPGDTYQLKSSKVIRLSTPITPFMDNLYLDTYYFYVPTRLLWEHWKEFNGENTASAWVPQTTYTIPQLVAPASTGWVAGTIADYFGIPTGVPGLSVNALPFRAYAMICNEWFRSEVVSDPLYFPVDDTTVTGVNTGTYVSDVAKGGLPYKAAKFFDYFTSALPAPQKGDSVGIGVVGSAPVYGDGYSLPIVTGSTGTFANVALGTSASSDTALYRDGTKNVLANNSFGGASSAGVAVKTQLTNPEHSGLVADLSSVGAISVNALRIAFQTQKLLERDARGGTRYTEILRAHFGVTSPDSRLQRPEYLGGDRTFINVNQVVQNSETSSTSPLGNTGAYSLTNSQNYDFEKSFTEHGFIIGVAVARYDHTYQQGLNRMWSRKTRYDYYLPVLANLGEQPIYNKEIYAQGPSVLNPDTGVAYDDEVFGYNEAWADYRYKPSIITGELRSNYTTPLDVWHLGDDYSQLPSLSESWLFEDKSNVDRVLQVKSSVSNQLLMDCAFDAVATRVMPTYSVPGLIDHH